MTIQFNYPNASQPALGRDSEDTICRAFENCIEEAKTNDLLDQGLNRVRKFFKEHREVFRVKLGPDSPAEIPPLVITPAEKYKPYLSLQRRYAQQQRDFIINATSPSTQYEKWRRWKLSTNILLHDGKSPALAAKKPGSSKFRFTVNLRGSNARTVSIQPTMPHLASNFHDISGSTCFGKSFCLMDIGKYHLQQTHRK